MGWDALGQWGNDVARIEPLAGGVANDVWSVRVDGQLAVGRLGARSDADLGWETALLRYLDGEGLAVPVDESTPALVLPIQDDSELKSEKPLPSEAHDRPRRPGRRRRQR